MPPDTARPVYARSGNFRQVDQSASLAIAYAITADDPLGPVPPPDGYWCAVLGADAHALWRRLSLKT